ncbi:4-aminobutyrate--2-oxoglutarate transaminase [Clostridium magnum]|uniref:(S)-3-amino-2-methylpropionate transaminase n=1 Tax=Clostridium magnum DSM 2767 TaxID=1121326 RepID=A0A161WRH1_9CLOT|nr:4-aminobutyrate--2-oxoglutarate transaminase [Clostridium magnum]KZL89318.1 5-aminovalerate aminotransferase DavT [Clostridium magnum DSM 2767]SHJ08443.1 4-aminobutyrate aminotransferase apoenzyme [Clostridium magnum DSM 2767]
MTELKEIKLITEIPGPKSQELLKTREKNVPSSISGQCPVFIKKGQGSLFEDVDGNVFLDFAGGIGVLNIGYCHPEVVEAVKAQAEKYFHTSINVIQYEQYIKLAEKINNLIPGKFEKKTMFVNSGAEADENAVKIARKYTNRSEIVCFTGAFHGRTLLTMTMTSKVKPYKLGFGPFAPGVHKVPFPYCYRCPHGLERETCNLHCAKQLDAFFLEQVAPEDVAAFIIEPLQGEGGFVLPPDEYIVQLRKLCDKHGILLICDEVQSGFCRTGKMFASSYWEEFGVYADIVTSAKSIAAGLPLSAVTARAEIMNSAQIGGIGGTYSGNPLATTAALKVIEIMERDNFVEKACHIGELTRTRLNEMKEKYELIGDVRGRGAMLALELVKDRTTKEPAKEETNKIVEECFQNGLVTLSCGIRGNVIRFLMPLVTTDEQLLAGLDILERAIAKYN